MKEIASLDGGSSKKSSSKPVAGPALKTGKKTDLRPLYAFLAAFVLYLFAMVIYRKYPLGSDAVLISDLKAQYAPFLALLRSKILELKNVPSENLISYLTYSFKLGLGKNFVSTFGYYLASPFNLIYLFVDESQINAVVMAIVVMKLSLSSGFMSLFLCRRIDDKKSLWPILFGIMYAFSLYSQAFLFQIMWLDGYMLLPLILFFTEGFVKKQKYLGLIISLLVLFVSNYYIAYMVGIACFLYLCIRMFEESVPLKKAICIGFRYVLAAGFTAMVTAVMILPVGLDTIRNADQTVSNRGGSLLTYAPLTFIHMFLLGESEDFDNVLPGNYPFLFICIPVVMLMILYFISPVFKGRERKIHAFCLIGAILSTLLYPLDKAWQVFDDPNWFWHRHAFVFLPLFLVISIKAILKIKEIARKDLIRVMLVMLSFVVIDLSFGKLSGQVNLALFNTIFILVYSALLMGFGVENWPEQIHDMPRMLKPLLSGILCFELVFASPIMCSAMDTLTLRGGDAAEYTNSIRSEIEYGNFSKTTNAASGAFRAETEKPPEYTVEHYVEDGEPFYGNYNGMAFFNSNSNKSMHHFMKQLGLTTNYNYFAVWHTFSCPSVDSFFSVGTVSARRDLDFYRLSGEDSVGTGLKFYANDNVLPLAFAADKGAMDFDFYRLEKDAKEKNYFAFQNDWYRSMFPGQFTEDFFNEIGSDVTGEAKITNGVFFNSSEYSSNKDLINRANNEGKPGPVEDPLGVENTVSRELKENMTTLYRSNSSMPIVVEYEFKSPVEGELYCSLVTGRIVDATKVYVNGVMISDFSSNTYYSQIFRLGHFAEGEDVKVTFLSNEDSWSYLNIRFANFDNDTFVRQLGSIDKSKVSVVNAIDGYTKFNVKNVESTETVLTTIPAEDGWTLYIDGAPAELKTYQNAFIAFDVPSGEHTAELVFTAPGLKTGAMASCAGVVLLAVFVAADKMIAKKKKS